MIFKKRHGADESLAALKELFAPLASIQKSQLPALEYFLLGAIAAAVRELGARPLVSERDASNVFSAIAVALKIATDTTAALTVPQWKLEPSSSLDEIRDLIVANGPSLAAQPTLLQETLMPRLQEELSHYAGNRTGQIRSSWGWTMSYLAGVPLSSSEDSLWVGRTLGEAVQLWEFAAGADG